MAAGTYLDTGGDEQGLFDTLSGGVWTAVTAPLPADSAANPETDIASVTCAAVGSCLAVGSYLTKKKHDSGLIEVLSGGTWTPKPELPAGLSDVGFSALTCPAVGSCVAVGDGLSTSGGGGVVATLTNGTWTATEAPLPPNTPAGTLGLLGAVSCSAVGSCVAVGAVLTLDLTSATAEGLIDTLSGGQWTATEAPVSPKKSAHSSSFLESVACPAVGSCVAGGFATNKSGKKSHGLLETLSDGAWSPVDILSPADAAPGQLGQFSSISCPATGSCIAVSSYVDTDGNEQGLIETFSDGTWAAAGAPLPADAAANPMAALGGITCPSAGSCVAVGSYSDTAGAEEGLVDTLSNGSWTATEAPLPASNAGGIVGAASTAMSTSIFSFPGTRARALPSQAVESTEVRRLLGNFETKSTSGNTVLSRLLSASRTAIAVEQVSPALTGVSCATVDACVAIGDIGADGGPQGVAETLSEGTWTNSAVAPADAVLNTTAQLFAVTCDEPASCLSVGSYNDATGESQGFVDALSGGTWVPSEVSAPSDAASEPAIDLGNASCPVAGSCVAVGSYATADGNVEGLVETLADGSWTATGAPLPAGTTGAGADLTSVSCPEVGSCVAAGILFGAVDHALIDTLSDGTWTAVTLPVPGKVGPHTNSALTGVTCPAVGSCVAVGAYALKRTLPFGLVETLTAGTWTPTAVTVPGSTGQTFSQVSGVSCAAVGSCVAVGSYLDSDGEHGLFDTLNAGTWAPTEAPSPSKKPDSVDLSSVSCPSSGACVAVGSYISTSQSTGEGVEGSFFETRHGKKWLPTEAPAPAGAFLASLTSVSCGAAGSGVSVGYAETETGSIDGLIETLSGAQAAGPSNASRDRRR